MRKAAATSTPSAADPQRSPTESPLPSIETLGRHLAAVERERGRIDEQDNRSDLTAARAADDANRILWDRAEALRSLIATMPAQTLADAAIQVSVTSGLISQIKDGDREKMNPAHVDRIIAALERVTLSVLPILASAAGLDPDAMDFGGGIHLRAVRFAGLEGVA